MKKMLLSGLCVLALLANAHAVSASFKKNDDVITAQLAANVQDSPQLRALPIKITTSGSVVTLSGEAMTIMNAMNLIRLTMAIAGVDAVDFQNLTFKHGKHLSSDDGITAQIIGMYIREGLINNPDMPSNHIDVKTVAGEVTLSGVVTNQDQAAQAVSLAQGVSGVSNVESNLTVAPSS